MKASTVTKVSLRFFGISIDLEKSQRFILGSSTDFLDAGGGFDRSIVAQVDDVNRDLKLELMISGWALQVEGSGLWLRADGALGAARAQLLSRFNLNMRAKHKVVSPSKYPFNENFE